MRYGEMRTVLASTAAAYAIVMAAPALAQTKSFNVPEQAASTGIPELARQADIQILVSEGVVRGKTTRAVRGNMSVEAALQRLLRGTGLRVGTSDGRTITLIAGVSEAAPNWGEDSAEGVTAKENADIVVTGTRIRGGDTPSPVISITAENIREEGLADLGEVIRNIPQNFSGGQNPGVSSGNLSGAGNANQNITGGSGLNLRGLGADATLTLLNGRRLAYGGYVQSVDISAIPVEALDRIEIVADGASAIYGSDAVGGVANVVLKRDYSGLTLGARYGGATNGGLTTDEYTATGGLRWSTGGLIATYKNTSSDPIYASQRRYTENLPDSTTIYPSNDVDNMLLSGHQKLGENVTVSLDALRNHREQFYAYQYTTLNRVWSETTTYLISPSATVSLPHDWMFSVGASWSRDESKQYQTNEDVPTSASFVAEDSCYCNETTTYDAGLEGPLFTLPGGRARLAVGAGYRKNKFRHHNYSTDSDTTQGEEGSRFAYAELSLPLVGPDTGLPGIRRLVVTAATRTEDYDSFGSVTTPKFGLIYDPNADFTLKASWGRSFKAPTLFERNYMNYALIFLPVYYGGSGYGPNDTLLIVGGGNTDLKPERAKTLSGTLSFHPQRIPGLNAEISVFEIDYSDRVVQPIADQSQALSNPIYAPFVIYSPSENLQAEAIGNADVVYNYSGADYDPANVVAILHTQYANVARQKIRGIDLSGSYQFELGQGRLTLRGSATWLDSWQQTVPTQSPHDLAGTLFNPARFNGRLGAVWNRGGFSASLFVNHTSGVRDTVRDEDGGSFTTFDATLRYATGQRSGVLSGLEFTLAAQNLFNQNPPIYTPDLIGYAVPYDSTNYSAVGRFLSFSISKHF